MHVMLRRLTVVLRSGVVVVPAASACHPGPPPEPAPRVLTLLPLAPDASVSAPLAPPVATGPSDAGELPAFRLGAYKRIDKVSVWGADGGATTQVLSCAVLARGKGDGLTLRASITGANYHVCEVQGESGPVPLREVSKGVFQIEGDEDGCRLTVELSLAGMTLRDPGGACTEAFGCGARIGLDGISFAYAKEGATCSK